MTEKKKATKAEIEERVSYIASLMLKGYRRNAEIATVIKGLGIWDVGQSQIDEYIRKARDLIKSIDMDDLKFEKCLSLERHDFLFRKALAEKDYKLALEVEKSRAKITGAEVQQINVTGNMSQEIKDLDKILSSPTFIEYNEKIRDEIGDQE